MSHNYTIAMGQGAIHEVLCAEICIGNPPGCVVVNLCKTSLIFPRDRWFLRCYYPNKLSGRDSSQIRSVRVHCSSPNKRLSTSSRRSPTLPAPPLIYITCSFHLGLSFFPSTSRSSERLANSLRQGRGAREELSRGSKSCQQWRWGCRSG